MSGRIASSRLVRSFRTEALPRALQPVQGDLSCRDLRERDMNTQLIRCVLKRILPQRAQDGRVFLVGSSNSRRLGEIETAYDTNSFGDIPVNTDKLRIPGSRDKAAVKVLIPGGDDGYTGTPLSGRDHPALLQRDQRGIQSFRRQIREPLDCGLLKQDSQLVQRIELFEVERLYLPAATGPDFQKAFAVQPVERLTYRRTAGSGAFGNLDFAEAIPWKQPKIEKLRSELFVHRIRQILPGIVMHSSSSWERKVRTLG
jgi:hypothetical protein